MSETKILYNFSQLSEAYSMTLCSISKSLFLIPLPLHNRHRATMKKSDTQQKKHSTGNHSKLSSNFPYVKIKIYLSPYIVLLETS